MSALRRNPASTRLTPGTRRYDNDGGLELADRGRGRGPTAAKAAERERQRQVQDLRRGNALAARCRLCFDNPEKPKHLHVSYGGRAYLMLPEQGRLVPGHCQIVPMQHGASQRSCDEDTFQEMRNFKKCLLRMFAAQGQAVLFVETHLGGGFGARHCVVDCVPVPQDAAARAPFVFKKAIDEAESEWSQHEAKKCISTAGKGLRASIPEHFPYFHVEWGLREGYVHVIDDTEKWNPNFGRDVLIGLLELPAEWTRAKQRRDGRGDAERLVKEFLKGWDPVDWTKELQ